MENNRSLFEHFSFQVDKGQTLLRIDKYLMNFVENATRTKIQAAAKNGSIEVNGNVVKSNYKVKPLDEIKVKFEYPPHENLLVAENIVLDIVYEDDDLVVINKPAGMVVHPGYGNYDGTLVNALAFLCKTFSACVNSICSCSIASCTVAGGVSSNQFLLEIQFIQLELIWKKNQNMKKWVW
mgnify:CR=1 FL=1